MLMSTHESSESSSELELWLHIAFLSAPQTMNPDMAFGSTASYTSKTLLWFYISLLSIVHTHTPNPWILRLALPSPSMPPSHQSTPCITSSFHPSLWPGRIYSSQLLAISSRSFRYGIRQPQHCHRTRCTGVLLAGHVQGRGSRLDMLHGL